MPSSTTSKADRIKQLYEDEIRYSEPEWGEDTLMPLDKIDLTEAQLASINSGATSVKIESINSKVTLLGDSGLYYNNSGVTEAYPVAKVQYDLSTASITEGVSLSLKNGDSSVSKAFSLKGKNLTQVTRTSTGDIEISTTVDLSNYSTKDHTHLYAGSSSAGGAATSVAHSLSISLNGGSPTTFNGSVDRSIDITPASIGASAISHNHDTVYSSISHTHTNGTGIGGPYALQSHGHSNDSSIGGPYSLSGHTHAWSEITSKPSTFNPPLMTSSVRGGAKIGYTSSGRNYAVLLDSDERMYVNVPWTDNDTTYDVATTSQNGLMSSSDKSKLDGIQEGAQVNAVTSVNNKTGAVSLSYSDVGAASSGHTHSQYLTSIPAASQTTLGGIKIWVDSEGYLNINTN